MYNIASALINTGTIFSPISRPSKGKSTELDVIRSSPAEPEPGIDIRYDNNSHWPEFCEDKRKGRLFKTGRSWIYCQKRIICLCLSNARNWFMECHTKYISEIYWLMHILERFFYCQD